MKYLYTFDIVFMQQQHHDVIFASEIKIMMLIITHLPLTFICHWNRKPVPSFKPSFSRASQTFILYVYTTYYCMLCVSIFSMRLSVMQLNQAQIYIHWINLIKFIVTSAQCNSNIYIVLYTWMTLQLKLQTIYFCNTFSNRNFLNEISLRCFS